ncbi:MAG TPA: ATP-grasp domain-containing protein [Arcobacter sp.]|nr:ATP-grasp domain-containing protein [Arcobacter sp.]
MKILTEASGSLVSAYLIKTIQESGHTAVASDVNKENHSICLADEFIVFPYSNNPDLWEIIEEQLIRFKIDMVIPSFDETLLGWAERKEYFKQKGIHILISNEKSLNTFLDKYVAYKFCNTHNIPTPKTSLTQDFTLVKPRFGRGGSGIYIGNEAQDMHEMISQELIEGLEYTVDCLFDKDGHPIYIIPRIRMDVKDGKSTKGIVVKHDLIVKYIEQMAKQVELIGPINFQFMERENKSLYFLEVNPRIAGGMALGIAASENWIDLIIQNFIENKTIEPKEINYGLKMMRYYAECFI